MSCICRFPERFYRTLALSLVVLLSFVMASRITSDNPHPLERPLQALILLLEVLGDWRGSASCNGESSRKRKPSHRKVTTSTSQNPSPPQPQNPKQPTANRNFSKPQEYVLWVQSQKSPYLPSLQFKIRAAGIPCEACAGPKEFQAFVERFIKTGLMPAPTVLLLYRPEEQIALLVHQQKDILSLQSPVFIIADPHQWRQNGRKIRDLLKQVLEQEPRVFFTRESSDRPSRIVKQLQKYVRPVDPEWFQYDLWEIGALVLYSFQKSAIRLKNSAMDREIYLHERLFRLFMYLLEHHRKLVTYQQIARDLWENPADAQCIRRIHTGISNLRKALGISPEHPCLQTVRNQGYILDLYVIYLTVTYHMPLLQ